MFDMPYVEWRCPLALRESRLNSFQAVSRQVCFLGAVIWFPTAPTSITEWPEGGVNFDYYAQVVMSEENKKEKGKEENIIC